MSEPADHVATRRSQRVEFPGGSGFPLAGIIEMPTVPAIARATFSHCFTCGKDLKTIVRLSRLLAQRGIIVLRFDMTGIGDSQGDFAQTNFETNLADLRAAVAYFDTQFDQPAFLIGHSFGGAASLALTDALDSIRGTVSIAAPSDTWHLADTMLRMNPAIDVDGVGQVTIGGRSFTIRKATLDQWRRYDLESTIAAIRKPILALHSPDDETVGYESTSRIVPRHDGEADGPAKSRSLITLPGSDHLLLKDSRDLEFVATVIAGWIERHAD
ncbi:alpha/beta hydrolase family protein [Rosistilla carotiformis]|uniref:alpha/beta hydrolase family protein n=1 Tax=Rosistilla carotiformis TaxID=2528017 RepID=UPI001E58EE95|nr:alpha/beta fold hydrolase [Rosistilla carotiformis]